MLPRNAPQLVDFALQVLGLSGDEVYVWTPNTQAAARGLNPTPAARGDGEGLSLPVLSRDVLAWLIDLSAVPSRRVLEGLARQSPCPPEAARLAAMAQEDAHKQQVRTRARSVPMAVVHAPAHAPDTPTPAPPSLCPLRRSRARA